MAVGRPISVLDPEIRCWSLDRLQSEGFTKSTQSRRPVFTGFELFPTGSDRRSSTLDAQNGHNLDARGIFLNFFSHFRENFSHLERSLGGRYGTGVDWIVLQITHAYARVYDLTLRLRPMPFRPLRDPRRYYRSQIVYLISLENLNRTRIFAEF